MTLRTIAAVGWALLALTGIASSQDRPIDQVNKAIDAIGRAGLEQLRTIETKGRGQFWEPDESRVAGGEPAHVADITFEIKQDLTRDSSHISWVRDYLELPWPRMNSYVEVITDGLGFAIGNDGGPWTASLQMQGPERPMSGNRLAATTRELKRRSPVLLLDMSREPQALSAHDPVTIGGQAYPAVSYRTELATYIVIFDPKTSLPARVRTMDFDPLHGDQPFDWIASHWGTIAGSTARYPFRQTYEVGGLKLMDFEVQSATANAPLNADLFIVPPAIRQTAEKIATRGVPYLWVLRRQLIGSYYDVTNLTHDPARVKLELVEHAPGVFQVQGTIHHTLIVEMGDHLIVFDAPYMDGYSKWVIEQAKQRFSNKPIRYLVLTHHHIDHVAGYRSFLAEGATLVVGRGTTAFWRTVLASKDTLGADTPKKDLSKAPIVEVQERHTLGDAKQSIELYDLRNAHSDGMLVVYMPHAKLGYQTDIWTGPGVDPMGARAMPRQRALIDLVVRQKLNVERFIGGHGRVARYSDLRQTFDGSLPASDSFEIINSLGAAVDFNVSQNGSYWIPFLLDAKGTARIRGGATWPAVKERMMFVNIITGSLRNGDRSEVTEKVELGKRYEIFVDPACNCRKLRPLS